MPNKKNANKLLFNQILAFKFIIIEVDPLEYFVLKDYYFVYLLNR